MSSNVKPVFVIEKEKLMMLLQQELCWTNTNQI